MMRTLNVNPMSPPVRVLVAEDSRDDSDLLIRQLRKSQMQDHVKIIGDGKEAWNFLSAHAAEKELIAIFLDLQLPSLSGLKLLCRIKSHPRLHNIPVILMTSSKEIDELDDCVRLGIAGCIAKPITFTSFTKAVADTFHSPLAWSTAPSE